MAAGPSPQIRFSPYPILIQVGLVLAAALLIGLTLRIVRLTPQIDASVFFGDEDPQLTEDRKIYKIFPQQEQIIINIEGKINSTPYLDKIGRLTQKLSVIPEVVTAKSLTHGPSDFEDALKSEFWRRILIPDDRKSSNIFIVLDTASPHQAIPKIETIVREFKKEDFQPVIAGIPYMIELIRRRLFFDLEVFSLSAVGVFGLMIFIIFRSFSILTGFLTASAVATSLTLLLSYHFGIGIGILTANLITIVFVLTIPHLIYLTYNWKHSSLEPSTRDHRVQQAFWETLPGSFWSMGTTLLGFLSLLLVQAKPLRQLGASGSIGTICALFAAYLVYPPFLLGIKPQKALTGIDVNKKSNRRVDLTKYSRWVACGFVAVCLLLGMGIFRLNTDPSLLSYFPKKLRQSLEHVDRNGGSGLMEIVLRDSRGRKLDTDEAYEGLWKLQRTLEQDPEIGTVISLPILMAEGERSPFSFLLSWKTILKKMEEPKYERIARSFVTYDHLYGHFILRMRESGRDAPRAEIIKRIKETVRQHGFTPVLAGGMYPLQAQLSHLIKSSLTEGLAEIVLLLGVIGSIVSRSIWVGLTMAFGMAMVPFGLLGLIGLLKTPLDIISAPAANLALGMGIDDTMIHMAERWRVLVKKGHKPDEAWNIARAQLWRPILVSMLVVCVGFSIFILSQFPPTRRFGLWVVVGTLLVLPNTLFFLPTVASMRPLGSIRKHFLSRPIKK